MGTTVSQITSLTIVYSTVFSDRDERKHQSSASLAFVWGIHRWPVNSPHKWPVTRKMFPFNDVIMTKWCRMLTARLHNSIANAQGLLQSCTKRPKCNYILLSKIPNKGGHLAADTVKTFHALLVRKSISDIFWEFQTWLHKEVLLVLQFFSLVLTLFHQWWT